MSDNQQLGLFILGYMAILLSWAMGHWTGRDPEREPNIFQFAFGVGVLGYGGICSIVGGIVLVLKATQVIQ